MKLANEIWKLARDVLLVLTGIFLTVALVMGIVPPAIAPTLVPFTFALFALPSWLRSDERKQRADRSRDASTDDDAESNSGEDGR